MGIYLDFGTGFAIAEEGYDAGKRAAGEAFKSVKKFEPSLVVVFSSVKYDLRQVLKGVREIAGSTPIIGGTTAGEFSRGYHKGSVVVSVIASPYVTVRVGIGRNITRDFSQALQEAIDMSGTGEYFNEFQYMSSKSGLDLDYAKKVFALVFLPGTTASKTAFSTDIIDEMRRRSLNALPLVGACTAADDPQRRETRQFYNNEVLTDSLVLAVVETHLKFGVVTALHHSPTDLQASITKTEGYEIKEFYYEPAAEFYAKLLDIDIDELRKEPVKYFTQTPMGVCDDFGNYSIIMGTEITSDNGIRCSRKPYPNITVTLMKPETDIFKKTARDLISKAIYRGKISTPSAVFAFTSAYWFNDKPAIDIEGVIRETVREVSGERSLSLDFAGFVSYGEIGLNDEGISGFMDYAVSFLMIADELNSASTVVFRNKILYEELSASALRNQVLYEELSAVHEMSNLLNSSLDLRFVINKAVELVGKIFQADGCNLFIFDPQTGNFSVTGLHGHEKTADNLNWQETLPDFVLKEGKPVIIDDTRNNSVVIKVLGKANRARSLIAAPITVSDEKVGVVSVYSWKELFFNESDLEFLQTLANQMGIAIVNARLFQQTQKMACTDGLTGLYDHNHFLKSLSRMMSKSSDKNLNISLIMVDLDDFKYYNDRFGHTVGDIILKETAEILRQNVRNNDIIARYGGDEFVVILVQAGKEKAFKIAERIRRKISQASFEDSESGCSFGVTASIGIATFPEDAVTAKSLIDSADKAMYRVKRLVKNKSQLYFSDFAEMEKEFTASEKAFFDTIKILVQILDSRDRYTWEHSRQVAQYTAQLADELGLPEEEKRWLRLTGYLHDIGKIHISPDIVNKKGPLTKAEMSLIKLHPVVGANLLAPVKGFKNILPVIYHHHECFDGSGYPDGLKGYDIPKGARILTVVDGYDAMTSNRPYRQAQSPEWAVEELLRKKKTQYDPDIVDVFVKMVRREFMKPCKKSESKTGILQRVK